jgi:hypothetical protein
MRYAGDGCKQRVFSCGELISGILRIDISPDRVVNLSFFAGLRSRLEIHLAECFELADKIWVCIRKIATTVFMIGHL